MFTKRPAFYILLPLFALVTYAPRLNAQLVSNQSGFYSVDSVFFSVKKQAPKGGKIEISVNCFTNSNCFNEYKKGVWLYNRNRAANTWEDQQFSKAPLKGSVDTLVHRGQLDKVNVVRVRVVSDNGTVTSDSAYFIGVLGKGVAYPYTLPVVQILVDSMDAFGPLGFYGPGEGIRNEYVHVWNYMLDQSAMYSYYVPRSRTEKSGVIEIMDKKNHLSLYQNCGVHLTGNESRALPNKSIEVVARKEYSNTDVFNTTLLDKKEDFHSIRFRSGGNGQRYGFGAHEIGESIIAGLNIGEVPVKPVIMFLNGSYWSLTFAQAEAEECAPADIKQRDEISLLKPQYYVLNDKFIELFHNIKVDTQSVAWATFDRTGKTRGTGILAKGNKNLFLPVSERLLGSVENNEAPLSFADIDTLVDLNSWLTYIAVADFGRIKTSIQHHVFIGTAPGKKMFLLMDEVKDFALQDPAGNHWKEHILQPDTVEEEKTFESVLIREVLLKNKGCIEKLCLRYQDLLNTHFKPERTIAIIDNLKREFLPEYGKYWRSWKSNAGLDSAAEVKLLESMKDFCRKRPDFAWQQLADQWLPNGNFHLTDRRTVRIVLDSVPAGTVKVHLNSLIITKDWNGLYYPDPPLEVSMEAVKVPEGYVLVWKEQPNMPESFRIPAQNNITLTAVLRRKR